MFIEIAKNNGSNNFWYYVVSVILVSVGYFLGSIPILIAITLKQPDQEALKTMDFGAMGIDLNLAFFLMLFTFIGAFFALWLAIARIHNRSLITVITSKRTINYRKILFAAGVWMLMSALIEVLMYAENPEVYAYSFQVEKFVVLLLIALFILPIQTSVEELFLRGYLMQGIGMRVGYRVVPLMITSVIFGLLHTANPEVDKFGFELMMIYYISFGIAAGVFTLMDESTEIALGLHWANNFFGAVFVSFEGSALKTYSLIYVSEIDPQRMLIFWIPMITIYGAIMAYRYRWNHWYDRIIGKGVQSAD